MLRVLIVDDSPVARELLQEIIGGADQLSVAGVACNGAEAVRMVQDCQPDVITMDIQMPEIDGYEATRQIMVSHPTPIVVVSGSTNEKDVRKSMKALEAGALTVIGKPPSPTSARFDAHARMIVSTIVNMSQVRVVRRHDVPLESETTDATATIRTESGRRFQAVVMAASTGGPQALQQVFSRLPTDFPLPILLVQHISTGFTDGFCTWLSTTTPLDVRPAVDQEVLRPATIYVAPEETHMGVSANGKVELTDHSPVAGFRPSATVLFESAAHCWGSEVIGVILTGMGADGCDGLRAVRKQDGFIIAQDQETSIVWGMPAAAVAAGLPDLVLPITRIGRQIRSLAMTPTH